MYHQTSDIVKSVAGVTYKKHVILADVNIPYKFSLDHNTNCLFFCINGDEYSNQSFHSVVLNLDTGSTSIIPDIRNGFASAVDLATSSVYLGGSDGIYTYSYNTNNIEKPPLIHGIDIFDMHFKNHLYFVDTANQNVYVYRDQKKSIVPEVRTYSIYHFVIDGSNDIIFVSSSGVYCMAKGSRPARVLPEGTDINFRGATTDTYGVAHFVAQDGIYTLDAESKQLVKIISVQNGYGLAFDKDNNIIYGDERSVMKLIIYERKFMV